MKDSNARLGKWAWILIYVGMFTFAIGVALADAAVGHVLWIAGIVLVVAGIALIGLRARRVDRASRAARTAAETSSTSLEAKP